MLLTCSLAVALMSRPLFDEALVGVDPDFAGKVKGLAAAVAERGAKLGIRSGYRTRRQQEALFAEASVKYADNPAYLRKRVARPGHSMHERGQAVDFSGSKASLRLANAMAPRFGLVRAPWAGSDEDWHFEPVGARGVLRPPSAPVAGQASPPPPPAGLTSPLAPGPLPGPDTEPAAGPFFLAGGANDPRVALFQAALERQV